MNTTRNSEDTQEWDRVEKTTEEQTETMEPKDVEKTESGTEESKEPVEEEPKEMTLDEYKKQQAAVRTVPKYNLRKPGEGEDNAQWKKTFRLEKKKETESEEESDEVRLNVCFIHQRI